MIEPREDGVAVDAQAAAALGVGIGDDVWSVPR